MISNKVLLIKDLAFNIPDNFAGDLCDALEILIESRRNSTNLQSTELDVFIEDTKELDAIAVLWDLPDKKCVLSYTLSEYDCESGDWIPIENKLVKCEICGATVHDRFSEALIDNSDGSKILACLDCVYDIRK